jgi:hypothetical protein
MIKLSFNNNKEILNFAVSGREIWYRDRIWSNGVRIIPIDSSINKTIIFSRNKIPPIIKALTQGLSDKDKKEYDSCKTEEELADKIRFDCKKQGLKEIK